MRLIVLVLLCISINVPCPNRAVNIILYGTILNFGLFALNFFFFRFICETFLSEFFIFLFGCLSSSIHGKNIYNLQLKRFHHHFHIVNLKSDIHKHIQAHKSNCSQFGRQAHSAILFIILFLIVYLVWFVWVLRFCFVFCCSLQVID